VRRFRNQGGFTLIEMIVVIAVLALVAGLVMTRQPLRSARIDLEVATRTVEGALRLARSQAIMTGRIIHVVSVGNTISIEGGQSWRLPSGVTAGEARLAFGPEGNSTGATIHLSGGGGLASVSTHWLTGRIAASNSNVNAASTRP
jgi:general secretion pathway protein H